MDLGQLVLMDEGGGGFEGFPFIVIAWILVSIISSVLNKKKKGESKDDNKGPFAEIKRIIEEVEKERERTAKTVANEGTNAYNEAPPEREAARTIAQTTVAVSDESEQRERKRRNTQMRKEREVLRKKQEEATARAKHLSEVKKRHADALVSPSDEGGYSLLNKIDLSAKGLAKGIIYSEILNPKWRAKRR